MLKITVLNTLFSLGIKMILWIDKIDFYKIGSEILTAYIINELLNKKYFAFNLAFKLK